MKTNGKCERATAERALEERVASAIRRMGAVGLYEVRLYESDRTPLWDFRIDITGIRPLNTEEEIVVVDYGIFTLMDRTSPDSFIVEFRETNTSATEVQEILTGGDCG